MGSEDIDITPPRRGSWTSGLLLVVLCLAVYLPGFFSIPVVDRDEARFAQASRQMMETGNYVVPMVQGRPRLNKPPLIYWLEAASTKVLTGGNPWIDAIWTYRVPSLLAAIATVLLAWRMGRSMFSPRVALLGAAILGACPIMFWESHQARADMLLLACTTAAVWMLWELWKKEGADQRNEETNQDDGPPLHSPVPSALLAFFLWLAVGLGVLTKGPVTLMVIGLAVLTLSIATHRFRWILRLQPVLGLLLVGAMIGPWVYLVTRQVGWDTYIHTISDEVLGRSLEPKEGHGGFPGYHTLLLPVLLFPGSLLIGAGLWQTWKDARAARRQAALDQPSAATGRASLFLLCTILPSWLVFEVIGTKLPHYTMPLYPALALIAARPLYMHAPALQDLLKIRNVSFALSGWLITLTLALLATGSLLALTLPTLGSIITLLVFALVATGLFIFFSARTLGANNIPGLMLVGLLAFVLITFNLAATLPRLDYLWVSRALVRDLDALDPKRERPVAAAGYQEDSLIFLTRGRIERIEDGSIDTWIASHPNGLLIVPGDVKYNMPTWLPLRNIDGFNYSKGRFVFLAIVERLK